ncbi:type II secretion system protein [Demequina sp. NBRC 110052]|uniref:type II secretion system protein n=1 Tax=Demequina sp. NBRC 110052 TaxID=1570341 RepID=UPI000A03D9A0|nr:prepilin-type N-terminal cleavage/methylation domain-containing protein [Demequina sp. NBRC 110052]
MIARIRKSIENKDQGFTLIELLVVMIIIGILAAVAIPIFLNQRKKAEDSAAKADVSTLGKEIATFWVDGTVMPAITVSNEKYYMNTVATDNLIGNQSNNVYLATVSGTAASSTDWCVSVRNDEGDVANDLGFKYSAQGGLEEGTCP